MATSKQNMKRIHKVTIRRMVDASPDTSWLGEYADSPDSEYSIDRAHACDCHSTAQDDVAECDCGTGRWDNREYRYFNPNVANYKGESDADIRKYCEQDYARMESLNSGNWCFIGIRVDAEYSIGNARAGYLAQELTSGGLWGIESDSSKDYLTSVESEELDALAAQLKGIGFSSRAIAAAFKNVTRKAA